MRAQAKGNQEEDDYEDDDFGSRKEGPSSNSNNKDSKSNDKANAIRSKHSVTEQRRRSKINERFQILRDLVPHSDQKRDTASFLLEVIEYVQYLQEKVQKCEGSYQGWNSEPTKLIPWRNSHWRVQNYVGHPPSVKNGPSSAFPGKIDENNISVVPSILTSTQNPVESDPGWEEGAKGIPLPMPPAASISGPGRSDGVLGHPLHIPVSDSQSTQCPTTSAKNQQEEFAIEGGTISIASAYSEGLLKTVEQALKNAGLDLSQASISVEIDLGKRAKKVPASEMMPVSKVYENPRSSSQKITHHRDTGSGEESDRAQKQLKG